MTKVIDLGLDIPPTSDDIVKRLKSLFMDPDGLGIGNYRRIFGPQIAENVGLQVDEIVEIRRSMSESEFVDYLYSIADRAAVDTADYVSELDAAGVQWGLLFGDADENDRIADFIAEWPEKFRGIATVDPFSGPRAVTELDRAVTDLGMVACYVSPYEYGIRADDPLFYPLYNKSIELDVPVFIYASMNYRTDRPMDIGRPLYLDKVARDFPQMQIVAECGGWPWVPELIGVAMRHSSVFINTCSHRPRYLGVPGSGWEMLIQLGNTLLQDRILFASGASDIGLPISDLVDEVKQLPLKESVIEKWLYSNAHRLFDSD